MKRCTGTSFRDPVKDTPLMEESKEEEEDIVAVLYTMEVWTLAPLPTCKTSKGAS